MSIIARTIPALFLFFGIVSVQGLRGSHVDRHEHIGKGAIGLTGFRLLMNDERFAHNPKILETPKSDDLHEDVENMNVLKSLLRNK
jgi:deoxyribonuclease-4